ncbi:MAG: hypothetical protein HYT72_01260 [Candidatus Aenigmarchaeota archaeon]|nr:hypothetical protein [Candidatus Aenigmarchaeota archaeon]
MQVQPEARIEVAGNLQDFFFPHIDRYLSQAGLTGQERARYLAGVLTYFATTRNLFDPYRRLQMTEPDDKRPAIVHIGDLMGMARKAEGMEKYALTLHTGEYALFMESLFEQFLREKGVEDLWLKVGKSSYDDLWLISRSNPRLYRAVAVDFESIVQALREMRDRELQIDRLTDSDFQYILRPKDLTPEEMKDRALEAFGRWRRTGDANVLEEVKAWWKRLDWDLSIFSR